MRNNLNSIVCLLFSFLSMSVFSQNTTNAEQLALNHFVMKIFPREYPEIKKVYFNGCLETKSFVVYPIWDCFENDSLFDQIKLQADKLKDIENQRLALELIIAKWLRYRYNRNIYHKKHKILVFRALESGELKYVCVTFTKLREYTHIYIFKISKYEVDDYCVTIDVW